MHLIRRAEALLSSDAKRWHIIFLNGAMKKITDLINKFQIFGILIIAIGSLIILYFNNPILGTIVVAFGTLCLTYGGSIIGKVQSERSSFEFQKQLHDFEKKLLDAQKLPFKEKETEISNIENEFMNWAKNFTSKKNEIELVYQKSKLAEEEYIIDKSIEARPYYNFLIDTIREVLKAYGSTSSVQIEYLSENTLSEKFFISYEDEFQTINPPYKATVAFDKATKWKIKIVNHSEYVEWKGGPQLNISQEPFYAKKNAVKSETRKFLVGIVFDLNEKIIRVVTNDAYFSNQLKETYPIDNYEIHIKDIIRILVEYQLSLLG